MFQIENGWVMVDSKGVLRVFLSLTYMCQIETVWVVVDSKGV